MISYSDCTFCPRACHINRHKVQGYCGAGSKMLVAKIMLHHWEEPVISGRNGSGAIFFSGCNLRCEYCQNRDISFSLTGIEYTPAELAGEMIKLQAQGAHNINLVTATPYLEDVLETLKIASPELHIPVVYNSSGYETVEAVDALSAYVKVFLPDLKYYSDDLSIKYSHAPGYNAVAVKAIDRMVEVTGKYVIDKGLIRSGVIVRHLILPGCRKDSLKVAEQFNDRYKGKALFSLMSQYTPEFNSLDLNRRITTFEYDSVLKYVTENGIEGFCQEKSSASVRYTPEFKK